MTIEELREHCEKQVNMCELWAKGNDREPSGKIYEEHKLILDLIKALEQQPEDCVSRQAVLDILSHYAHNFGADNEIKSLPPVKPTRKVGEWCKQNDDYFDWYECSECGYGSEGEMQYSSEYDVRTNFCPNCGADMRGSENGL